MTGLEVIFGGANQRQSRKRLPKTAGTRCQNAVTQHFCAENYHTFMLP